MTSKDRISPEDLADAMRAFASGLRSHKEVINRLNVYPVPDGDTGSNMSATVESVISELPPDGAADDAGQVSKAISHGSLMGARGNSGVILSQLLRGFSDVVGEHKDFGAKEFADALSAASDAAYKSVLKPVEGTVLSVAREAASAAKEWAEKGTPLAEVVERTAERAREALANTPNQLEALKRANVVDAGGKGFTLFFDALLNVIDKRPMPEPEVVVGDDYADVVVAHEEALGDFRYEVMFLLEDSVDARIDAFKMAWAALGDSIVVVGGDGLYNCHVHTNEIGEAIEAALTVGRPRNIRVTDMFEQSVEHHDRLMSEGVTADEPAVVDRNAAEPQRPSTLDASVATAVVAVANGDGIAKILESMGVQSIVTGGQSMNPSTAQLLAAVEAAPSRDVVILPNNKNIIPVAQQLESLTTKTVVVVPTKSIPSAFGALFNYSAMATIDANANSMTEGAESILAGEVTRAVRDTEAEIGLVKAGDFIGICDDGLISKGDDVLSATVGLLRGLIRPSHEVLTLLYGGSISDADAFELVEQLEKAFPDITIELHSGGQPLYELLIGVE